MVDPAGPPMPTDSGPQQDVWLDKDITALLHINCHIGDNAMLVINEATHAREAWITLLKRFNGAGAQDASITSSNLHSYKMDG